MQLDYTFLMKRSKKTENEEIKDEETDTIEFCEQLFSNIAVDGLVKDGTFVIRFEDKEYDVEFSCRYNGWTEKQVKVYLNINNNLNTAKVLSLINKKICSNEIRQRYYINNTYDECSEYLCNKAYPMFNAFERKIRKLIYLILVKSFGIYWPKQTMTKELIEKVKGQQHNSLILEKGLQEMNISDLEDFLFKKRYWCNVDEVLATELNEENVANMEKDEIIDRLKQFKKTTLWEKCFSKIQITDLENKLERIRNLRNKVAHFKDFSYEDYLESKKILRNTTKEIDCAIDEICAEDYDIIPVRKLIETIGKLATAMTQASTSIVVGMNNLLKNLERPLFNMQQFNKILYTGVGKHKQSDKQENKQEDRY